MKKFINIIIIILLAQITTLQPLISQDIKDIENIKGGYLMDQKIYLKKDMNDLFKHSQSSLVIYKKAKKQRVIAHITAGLGAASSIFGLVIMDANAPNNRPLDNSGWSKLSNNLAEGYFSFGVGMLAVGVGLGITSYSKYKSSNNKYKEALDEYRTSSLKANNPMQDDVIIRTNISGNGISLFYNF